ncbi:MAG: UDP-N-acetylglucosamine 1-carboxyvinyltransferase, partial [Flavobacteriaceae bacterium]|nr:UDP-N-acetylglucosamine 1-carboxyvinyltransferase [Flavobacteriaceae bacterium]
MSIFKIEGGHRLQGDITPQGAKNEALQVICAVLLTSEKVTISNIPDIRDVNKLIFILGELGVKVEKLSKNTYTFQANEINLDYLESFEFKRDGSSLRGSIMIVGPLLTRFGKGYIPRPGGDKIGRRRLDTHFEGFINLGAKFRYNKTEYFYGVEAKNGLTGKYMLLDEASVTGTANILMASVMAKGITTIYNAACEPYIQQLSKMLVSMGAKISGIGSNKLIIEGVEILHGCKHRILPDMIEIGSWIGMAVMTRSELTIKDVSWDDLGQIPNVFRKLGINLEKKGDDIHIPTQESYEIKGDLDDSILTVSDAPWPGFTPDLLSIVLVVATQAKGSVLIHQKMFE